jgi:Ca2+-binding RTX toxin-like protein
LPAPPQRMSLPLRQQDGHFLHRLLRYRQTRRPDVVVILAANNCVRAKIAEDIVPARAAKDRVHADTLFGDEGNDRSPGDVGVDTILGGTGRDDIFGNFGADTIVGGEDNDNIRAGGSGDNVEGGAGNDRLVGGNGKDILWGGAGNDVLFGGGGNGNGDGLRDVFIFKSAAFGGGGFDIIRDFEDTTDKIDLSDTSYSTFADVFADAQQVGANVEIKIIDGGGLVRINDFALADLTSGDILF